MEKKNALKRRAAEEMKTDPQTYHEEASSASADLETAVLKRQSTGNLRRNFRDFRQQLEIPPRWRMTKSDRRFLLYNNVYNSILIFCTEENLSILSEHSVWFMDGTFKIVPEWYQQMFTIHGFIAGGSVGGGPTAANNRPDPCTAGDISAGQYTRLLFPFLPSSSAEVKMLLATAFLPPHDVPVAVELLGRDATGSIAALFNYFRVEWMPPDRLPMWNVYNVNIRTNNDLESWHFKMNRLPRKRHFGFYELLQLLIDEQGINGNVESAELQQRITALTAEYDGGTRSLEQFLRAVAYLVPEAENY
ncbi:hypothetical protein T06_519 [Trichinella sp. T6]|nr:hypothetical protein T06_519 [Trichinella sp. T6]